MIISTSVLNTALNLQFNSGDRTYTVKLLYVDSGAAESSPETIDFSAAANGIVQLVSSVFFAVPSGYTVDGIQVEDDLSTVLIEEDVTDEVFTADGTFTINNIIVQLED
jgi:hypothetical protein